MVDVRGVSPGFAPSSRVSSLSFSAYSATQLTSMSVKKITNPETFDSLLHPNLGGLYDPALGPTDKHDVCSTCGLIYVHCPGHMGHISLPLPVYHPLFFTSLYQLLQASCWACHRLLATPTRLAVLQGRLALLGAGRLPEAAGLEAEVMGSLGANGDADSCVQAVFNIVSTNLRDRGEGTRGVESSRNVIGAKRWEVHEFLRHCSRGQGSCPHCQAPARPLRQDGHVRIFLKGLSKKQAGQWMSAMHRERGERCGAGAEGCTLLEPLHKQDVTQQLYVSPVEVKFHIQKLWEQEGELLKAIFEGGGDQGGGLDLFFLTVLPVPPSRFRPISQMGEKRFENPQTMNLQSVLSACAAIHQLLADREGEEEREGEARPGTSFSERLQFLWCQLQGAVNVVMDSSKEKKKKVPNGIKQILEKKEGLFRMNMMGKRVDFAARSVISPDPYINMDEIGIPMVFAKKLTYPQPVTAWNVKALRQAVINGPNVHPGATHVQLEDGSLVLLNPQRPAQRMALARQLLTPGKHGTTRGAPKKVFRHLQDGDVLLMNRQPTLHKPSIMAHKARVLPGEKTMRLHYANCKCYNADFDGDEMNAHFPQNELARAEAYNIVSTHSQYLVPKDGTPLSGLIQDHVVSGLLMTLRGRHFHRHDYHQLVLAALPRHHQRLVLLPPCHLKPAVLWSGKQVVSTVLLNIIPDGQQPLNLLSKAKISPQEWGRGKGRGQMPKDTIMTESEVVFRGGQLLCGVLDKSQFGASQFGFIHSCQELYGGGVANQLLSALGCLFTTFLQLHGFTLGVEDILVTPEADKMRKEHIQDLRGCGQSAAADAFSLFTTTTNADTEEVTGLKYASAHRSLDPTGIKNLDYCFSRTTSKYNNLINMACVPSGLHKPFPANNLQLMVQSGAKGSTVNCMQISCLLGQIELEGQRPPLMPSGSFLPSFPPYDTSPRAGGFVEGRFLTGIRPQEYFFHCMAGREGLVDTAVKTSRSGYLQRCLIKHLEGLTVNYDLTVRDSDGSVVQFLYGEDGLDVCQSNFLQPSLFPFLLENHMALTHGVDFSAAEEYLDLVAAHKHRKKVQRWAQRHGRREGEGEGEGGMEWRLTKPHRTAFLVFSEKHLPFCQLEVSTQQRTGSRSAAELQLIAAWYSLNPQQKKRLQHKCRGCLLPALSMFRPDRYFGSIPEKLDSKISSFLMQSDSGLVPSQEEEDSERLSVEKFESLIQFKYLRSLAQPGEAVGLLAAQSIGEPSTQMTLNTFHFAGRGEMNVTLGIPRLREILMTASPYIKTPAMEVPLQCLPQAQARGEQLKKHFTRVCLNQVLEQAEVWETIGCEGKGHRYRQYTLRLSFLPHQYYESDYVVTPSQVLHYVEKRFVRKLVSAVNREIKLLREKRLKAVSMERERAVSGLAAAGEGGEVHGEEAAEESDVSGSDMEDAGADATAAKDANKKRQHSSYEDAGDSDHDAAGLPDEEGSEEGDGVEAQGAGSEYDSEGEKEREEEEEEEEEEEQEDEKQEVQGTADTAVLDQDRINEVISSSGAVVGYSYDPVNELSCTLTLKFPAVDCKVMLISVVERLASKCVVWEVPHIFQGFLSHDEAVDQWILKTDGVNLEVLREYEDIVELNRVYTNSIHSMADTYGIEAAVTAIVREISTVFKVYNIAVDPRHLSLIADYMTFEGSYKPFNRIGLEANSSPLQKMSFETTMSFLKTATLTGSVDKLTSPSACLVAGRVVHGGTGAFELLQSLT